MDLTDMLDGSSRPNLPQNGELVKDTVLPPLRISSNLFPSSVVSSASSPTFQESQLAVSVGLLEQVESPYAPILPVQTIVKTEMSALQDEYVEYEEWDAEVDIKNNLLFKRLQPNIEALVKKEVLNVSWVDDDDVIYSTGKKKRRLKSKP